jgi:hypothetical protein
MPAPKPSLLLTFNAVAVILACSAASVYFLWILATRSGPLLILGGPLMIFVPPLLAAMQYYAVFRAGELAARRLGKYLFIGGGLLAIFFAMLAAIHVANNKEIDFAGLGMLLTLTAVFAYLLFCGWTNQCWADRLAEWKDAGSTEKKSPESGQNEE